jgi:hypothetical protein
MSPAPFAAPSFWKPYFLLLGSEDALAFGRGGEPQNSFASKLPLAISRLCRRPL